MNNKEELKPCKCGRIPIVWVDYGDPLYDVFSGARYQVGCGYCGIFGDEYMDENEAIRHWNKIILSKY